MTQQVSDVLQTRGNNIFGDGGNMNTQNSMGSRFMSAIRTLGASMANPVAGYVQGARNIVNRAQHSEPSQAYNKVAARVAQTASNAGIRAGQSQRFQGGGGGRMGGGGAGMSLDDYNYSVHDSTYVRPFIPTEENFRDAFANARKSNKNSFTFQNNLYNTNVDTTNNIDHDAVARQRIELGAIPLDTTYLHDAK